MTNILEKIIQDKKDSLNLIKKKTVHVKPTENTEEVVNKTLDAKS